MAATLTIRDVACQITTPGALDVCLATPNLSENERHALEFCRAWLAGATSFVMHTSGSTGAPKAITLSRAQMEASARATGAALGLAAGDRALICLSTGFIAGRMMLVRGLVLGLDMLLVDPGSDPLESLICPDSIDFAAFVPLQMRTLLETALTAPGDSCYAEETERAFCYRNLLEGMKAILIGGGPVSPTLATMVGKLRAPVFHTYGMTETATHVALRRLNGPEASDAFHPLPGIELRVDHRNCLAISGPVTGGVWLQTNDVVDLRNDQTFVWLGRWDNVINSGGVKVQVERVEAAVERLQAAAANSDWARRRFFVAGLPDERLGQIVTLFLEGTPLTDDEEASLRALLRAHLDRYMVPRRFAYVPRLLETPTGKIDRTGVLSALHQ